MIAVLLQANVPRQGISQTGCRVGRASRQRRRQRRRGRPDRSHAPDATRAPPMCPAKSSGSTGTAAWARIGPSSICWVTRCTVHPCSFHACRKRTSVGMQARKGRQQAGMDVQHAALPGLDQKRGQQPHVTREADDLDPGGAQHRVDRRLVRCAIGAEPPVIDHLGLERPSARAVASPTASGRLETTSAIRREKPDPAPRRSALPCWSRGR